MGCSGACCAAFPIGATLDRCRVGDSGYRVDEPQVSDGDLLGFMLREITVEEARERRAPFLDAQEVNPDETYYRCIYWDEQTHLCGAYEERPVYMCGEYPYPPVPYRCNKAGEPTGIAGVCEHGCDCQGAPLVEMGTN